MAATHWMKLTGGMPPVPTRALYRLHNHQLKFSNEVLYKVFSQGESKLPRAKKFVAGYSCTTLETSYYSQFEGRQLSTFSTFRVLLFALSIQKIISYKISIYLFRKVCNAKIWVCTLIEIIFDENINLYSIGSLNKNLVPTSTKF